jgi:hypothetical protein
MKSLISDCAKLYESLSTCFIQPGLLGILYICQLIDFQEKAVDHVRFPLD